MESNSWSSRFSSSSSSSRRCLSRSDLFLGGGYEEVDADDDLKAEFLCPFCAEDFDIVGLCCHIEEEHPVEAKNGACPVCAKRVEMDIISHITTQHGNFLKVQRKRRLRKGGGSNLTFSMLRKELREGNLQALLGGSSCFSSSNSEPDPLLSSFIFNTPTVGEHVSAQPISVIEESTNKETLNKEFIERTPKQSQQSEEEQEEKARKSEFVQGLLLSTIFGDKL